MDQNSLIVIVLAMLCSGGLFYALAYPYVSGSAMRERRQNTFVATDQKRSGTDRGVDQVKRRQQISESLKELEKKHKRTKRSLEDRIRQAGLEVTRSQFMIASGITGLLVGAGIFVTNHDPIVSAVAIAVGGFGLPQWALSFLFKRRIKLFVAEFPNAVDVIIRGVKAGLPIGDCMRIIASESAEPVRSEFRRIVEGQAIGLSIGESVERLTHSMPIAEANFFSIVINLQQKSGGNLSEALGNLARVLRDRKKMKMKIKAMSSEAKASAGIIGSIPFVVAFAVWLTTPDYISLLWTTGTGRQTLAIAAGWMSLGIFIMKKMINFDF